MAGISSFSFNGLPLTVSIRRRRNSPPGAPPGPPPARDTLETEVTVTAPSLQAERLVAPAAVDTLSPREIQQAALASFPLALATAPASS
jgi:hypothetical protein